MISQKSLLINLCFLSCGLWLPPGCESKRSYSGHQMIRAFSEQQHHTVMVRETVDKLADHCQMLSDAGHPRPVDLLCSESGSDQIKAEMRRLGLNHEVTVSDFGRLVEEAVKEDSVGRGEKPDFTKYLGYSELLSRVDALAAANPDLVSVREVGTTHEGRRLVLMKIGRESGESDEGEEKRKAVWIDAGIHAREWIAPMSTLYCVEQLLDRFNSNAEEEDRSDDDPVTQLDWYVLPLLNPDGYEYSRQHDRMWRKNRAEIAGSDCRGVDLNRNWRDSPGFGVGASRDPCSDVFNGDLGGGDRASAFVQQPEVEAASTNLLRLKDRVRAALSVHSFGSKWLAPWGFKNSTSRDADKMMRLGRAAADAIEKVNNRTYEVGAAGIIFSAAGGASDDFAKAIARVPYSATIELPGDDEGFALPAKKILGVGRELWSALQVVAKFAHEEPEGEDRVWLQEMEEEDDKEDEKKK